MAELSVDDLIAFSGGRLEDTDETQRNLDAALSYARNYCGWHVTPVHTDEDIVMDGNGHRHIQLPTKHLLDIIEITSDGTSLDPDDDIYWWDSGRVVRRVGRWSRYPRGITATIDHGYTETEAAAWRGVVLGLADRLSMSVGFAGVATSLTAGPYVAAFGGADISISPGQKAILDYYATGNWL